VSGELAYLGLAEAAELIRTKKLSPVEYVTALLARIESYDAKYNAFIAFTPERALKAARAAEAEITAGRWRGAFHGVPYALKDIIDVEGLATTPHSKILKGNIARRHAVVTERLEAAGGVLLGKLSTHEFAIGGPSFDLPWPPARNPWNRDHFCGGSSSGSGAGLARILFGGTWHRHRRLDPQSGLDVRRHRHEAHLWQGQPPRRSAARLLPRPCRADDPHGARQRTDAPGDRRA
jgi:aspartyl-tRNA(Asn)/glutamyl-tRNA(Gln) amidotransferase subunit A